MTSLLLRLLSAFLFTALVLSTGVMLGRHLERLRLLAFLVRLSNRRHVRIGAQLVLKQSAAEFQRASGAKLKLGRS